MAYTDELQNSTMNVVTETWQTISSDPNCEKVMRRRAEVLAAAYRPPVHDRNRFIAGLVRGKKVLDIGCVAHDEARMKADSWLHRHVANSAADCVGIDVLPDGVDAMRSAGYDAVVADLSDPDDTALSGRGLFEVIVAGEIIEHVADLNMLFEAANKYLTIDGELVITTPNPYAPARVRAGRRGDVWENVDHVAYAFPSGIAELAERHGLMLAEATTCSRPPRQRVSPLRWAKRAIRRSQQHRRGFATTVGSVRPTRLDRRDHLDALTDKVMRSLSSNHRFTGETAIYIVTRGYLD